jgi:hypothetical protein
MSDNFYDDLEDDNFVPMIPNEDGVETLSTPSSNDDWTFGTTDPAQNNNNADFWSSPNSGSPAENTAQSNSSADFWNSPNLGSSFENADQTFNFNTVGNTQSQAEQTENIGSNNPNGENKLKLGYKSVGLLIAGLLIVVAIVISLISGALKPKGTTPQQTTTPITQTQQGNSSVNGSTQAKSNTSTNTNVQGSTKTQSNTYSQDSTQTEGNSTSGESITEVNAGTVSYASPQKASAIVSSKKTYVVGNSLVYDLELNINDGDAVCSYFCSKSAYDAVTVGSTVKVTYSVAQNGYIGVESVVK